MSLRYRLDKDRFKGKKLPPKSRTNEDHISADQRGDDSSLSDPLSDSGMKHSLKRQLAHESEQFSRRGLFKSLNSLKEYASEQDKKQAEKAGNKVKKVRRKKKPKEADTPLDETEVISAEEILEPATEPAETVEPADLQAPVVTPQKRAGIFKRVKEHFFPSLELSAPEPAPAPSVKTSTASPSDSKSKSKTIEMISPTDVVEEARKITTDVPADEMTEEDERQMDRRHMIKESIHFFAKPAVDRVQNKIDKVNNAVDKITKRPPLLRPPGAISEKQFLQACTRCDKCIQACPKDAIKKVPKKMGWIIMDTPFIDPMKVPCVMCDDLPCISACQDEALLPVAAPADVKMGYVILDKKHCVAYGDGFCQQCLIDCPIPGAITQNDSKPVFHRNICTGCGACVRACATVNIPVALKVKPQMVIEAQQMKKQREKDEAEMAIKIEEERKRIEAEAKTLRAEEAALAREKGWVDEEEN